MTKYPIILFDADNTLFDFYRAEREALCDALQAFGVATGEEKIATYSKINDAFWKKLERGEVTKSALRVLRFAQFCEHYALDLNAEHLAAAYTDFLSQKQHLMPGALEACRALHKHCKLYIITNGISTVQQRRFEASVLCPYFEGLFISEELGAEKPRREYFDAVAAAIPGFDPHLALVVGDSLSADINGGILAGIDTCWINWKGAEPPKELPITYVVSNPREVVPLVLS